MAFPCRQSARVPFARLRRGVTVVYVAVLLVALCGLVSVGVDYGRVQVAKSELQAAADAAARAAGIGAGISQAQARSNAVSVAAANSCAGVSISLDPNQDVEFGSWDNSTQTFTPGVPGYALRVTARRIAARNNPVPLIFAKAVGKSGCDVIASSVITYQPAGVGGFVGLNSIAFHNNTFYGSYNPNTTTDPTQASAGSNAVVGTNGDIEVHNNNTVKGQLLLGPSATIDYHGTLTVTGGITNLPSPIPAPTLPAWNPQPNPNGIPQNYTVNSNRTLPGGTYYFTTLTIDADLFFSGPAVIHVNGNIIIKKAEVRAYQTRPANLIIYQHGTNRTFGDPNGNDTEITAHIVAPGASAIFNNKVTIRGSATFNTMEMRNNAEFFFDETSSPPGGGMTLTLRK
jgi:Flp pilus assembly protein TadG